MNTPQIKRWLLRLIFLLWLVTLLAVAMVWARGYYAIEEIERIGGDTDVSFSTDRGGLWIDALWDQYPEWLRAGTWYHRVLPLEMSEHEQPAHAEFYFDRRRGNPNYCTIAVPFWA